MEGGATKRLGVANDSKEGECAMWQDQVESVNSFLQSQPVYTSIRFVATSS